MMQVKLERVRTVSLRTEMLHRLRLLVEHGQEALQVIRQLLVTVEVSAN